jgi:glyoxylase-like metal-dependent hydrolase (beta-lactamase superfamily II)
MYDQRQFGDVRVHRILDQEAPFFDPLHFFPDLNKEVLEQNLDWFAAKNLDPTTGKLILAVQSYVVQTPHHIILIDSCVGNDKPRPTRPFWHMMKSDRFETALSAAGFRFEDIDYVMCTHLHVDHVGWNTKLDNGRWVPTFPKAKYLFADRELEFWLQRHKEEPAACPWINDSVLPIVEAKRSEIVQSNYAFSDLVQLVATPGHTIDHYSVHVGRPGADALITGDMVHSPLQVRYPELGMMADYSSTQAADTRRRVFEKYSDTSTLMCTAHFPSPSVGRIESSKGTFQFLEC